MYNRQLVFAAACLGILLFGIGLITLGSVHPDLKEKFLLDDAASGTLFSIMPLGILAGSLIFGPACDRFGYKPLLTLSGALFCVGLEGIAFANKIVLLKFFIFLFGVGGGAINGATNAVVADISKTEKGANLSLLGIFFGIGALGMPLVMGLLRNRVQFEYILASIGLFTFLITLFFLFIQFPVSKLKQGFPLKKSLQLAGDKLLLLIAFFLFFQSSFEAIINNWTPLFLVDQLDMDPVDALFALSLYVAGLTVMRILIGSVFRRVDGLKIMFASIATILVGLLLLKITGSQSIAILALILIGAGLSAGFPIMLGIVGSRFAELSGTAFSFVLVIALIGNILVNYAAGLIAQRYGIANILTVAFIEVAAMLVLCYLINKKSTSF